ncbi:MAG: hypothetical protein WEB53_09310 [Akkermansiaceae bacterium]
MNHPEAPDAIGEAEALRLLGWPTSNARRSQLRATLPSIPSGGTRLFQRSAVEALAKNGAPERRETSNLFTR